ncbi:hypothetical protein SAMD00019534_089390 [Acytostelium subglobosum LB1]|uniref:hypothetical protein n=1 Tax=Acytostelium subglobosum LB1 TaxID=1410327 RepID=UPI000644CAB9|nr:hypothetical protein SAMD00019534_089390 [Acytostelium subglobosum LB1]GAM25764.1 hypothetical protein SAMD00019534_089390 [Acytostelium subglobosum LB1]|eukprot:XP_012751282.1 hypothetical protein SAMD00019534_089390 [Acytostelium subglobosum LB1]
MPKRTKREEEEVESEEEVVDQVNEDEEEQDDDDDTATTSTTSTTSTTTTTNSKKKSAKTDADDESKRIMDIFHIDNIDKLTEHEFHAVFDTMANRLLNDVVLMVGGVPHMLNEIEYYFKGYNHVDQYAHGDVNQQKMCTWYFHRQNGGAYKTASYKGLDMTFGDGTAFAGILIRGIERVDNKPVLIDGPSLCVDHLLKVAGEATIDAFVAKHGTSLLPGDNKHMHLVMRDHAALKKPVVQKPIASGRVGLTMKLYRKDKEYYFGRDYRYIRMPDKVKKGKHYMNTALYKQGMKAQEIKDVTKSTIASIGNCIKAFDAGVKKTKSKADLDKYKGSLSNDDVCELVGVCHALEKMRGSSSTTTNDTAAHEDDVVDGADEGEALESDE